MRKLYTIVLLAIIGLSSKAQVVYIPDPNFKAYLLADTLINTNKDTAIQVSEAQAYSVTISVHGKGINDLTGIEAFTAIRSLDCSSNNLTSLNVSSNTALRSLGCNFNNLTSLNVSSNVKLNYIQCSNNNLTSLDATSNILLTSLYCDHNSLTSLNVKNGNNHNMPSTNFYANNNTGLTCIEVDSVAYSTANWTHKDAWASFSTACSPLAASEISAKADVNIYPNPVTSRLTIQTIGKGIISVNIYDVMGKAIRSNSTVIHGNSVVDNRMIIDMNEEPAGIYIIGIKDGDNHTFYRNVVKQ